MKQVRWGVIGCGGIADLRTIPGLLCAENATLVAVMDRNLAVAERIGAKYHASYAGNSIEEFLAQDIDAVYIATPVFCHKEQAIAAMMAGKHVLIEKPVGLTSVEAEEVKVIAEKQKVKLGVGMMMRFHTHHQIAKKMVDEGILGELVSLRSKFTCWFPEKEGDWRQAKSKGGGGALMDLGVHCIDLVQYITGLKACGVAAFCEAVFWKFEVDDSASLLLKMNNGAHLYVDVNFNIPDDCVRSRLEIYGTKGSIVSEGTLGQEEVGSTRVSVIEKGFELADHAYGFEEANTYELDAAEGNMYTKEISAFSNAVLENAEPPVSIEDAILVQKIAEAAYQSCASGTFVSI